MNWRNIGLAAVILLLPVVLILLFRTGTTKINDLEIFGPYEIIGQDTNFHQLSLASTGIEFPDSNKHILLHINGREDERITELAEENIAKLLASETALQTTDFKIYTLPLSVIKTSNSKYRAVMPPFNGDRQNLSDRLLFGEWKEVDLGRDNLAILIDKDGRIRGYFYLGNGRFHKEFLGKLNVLRHEYSRK